MAERTDGRALRLLIGPAFCLLLAGVIFLDLGASSPGPIIAAHDHLVALRGADGCVACHGSDRVSLGESCTKCHEDIAAQLRDRTGIHGGLPEVEVWACGACHKEHRGAGFRPVSDRAFYLAGIAGGMKGFRHEGFDFELTGKHVSLECEECHEHLNDDRLEKGNKRFLGLSQDCASCHDDPHEGKLPGCADCHGQADPFDKVALFRHDRRFPLSGGHADRSCKECHKPNSGYSIETVGATRARTEVVAIRSCGGCHDSWHEESFIQSVAEIAAVKSDATCKLCHDSEHADFYTPDLQISRRFHRGTGFELSPPHDTADCRECHRGIGKKPEPGGSGASRKRSRGRTDQTCADCHEDPHKGQFTEGPFAGGDCRACHDELRFSPAAFGLEHHAKTRFPLDGAHQAVGCRVCHRVASSEHGRVFQGTPTACVNCHEDVHDGVFDGRDRPESIAGQSGCARCHDANAFRMRDPRAFDHKKWTSFALTGRHAKARCEQCHPRTAGTHHGTRHFAKAKASATCADCHDDPHAGQFRSRGRTNCVRCHTTKVGFELTVFDHTRHSRFKLDKSHEKLACAKCHKEYALKNGAKAVRYKPLGTRCADCHGWQSMREYETSRGGRER